MAENNAKAIYDHTRNAYSMTSLNNQAMKKSCDDMKDIEQNGSLSNDIESVPQSPVPGTSSQKSLFQSKQQNSYSIKIQEDIQEHINDSTAQKNNSALDNTPRKHSIDSQNGLAKYSANSQVKQIFAQPMSSRFLQERNSHVASTVMHTDHSNYTDVNTSITKQSSKKGLFLQLENQANNHTNNNNNKKQFSQSTSNLNYPFNSYGEMSVISSSYGGAVTAAAIRADKQEIRTYEDLNQNNDKGCSMNSQINQKRITNKDGNKYVYGENTYQKEEVLDENLMNKITEYVDKSDYIKELGQKLSEQIDWKIELDNAFLEVRKENRKKNNKISKGNNMNLITFFPVMQDVFKNLKSDRNKEKLMQKYKEGEMLTNEQLSFLASTNKLLNRFIDRDYLDKGVNFFKQKGIQGHLEFLLAENIIQTYELIKDIIYTQRRNYLLIKNRRLLNDQDMFKTKQEQKVIDLQKAKEKLKMNKRMEAVCRSLDKKLIEKEQERIEQQHRSISSVQKTKSKDPISNVAQKFVNNIKKSLIDKSNLRDIFITNISKPKQQIKIEEIKQKKKNDQQKQQMLQKISYNEGNDLLSRLTNKAQFEDDPKNLIRQSYHPSSKIFLVEENKDEEKQLTNDQKKMIQYELKRFKRKVNSSKAADLEEQEKQTFSHFYTGGPLQSSYINSKYYGQKQIQTIIRLQAVARGYLARKILKQLQEKKKRAQEIRRKAEKTREKMLLKERIKLELFSPRSAIEKMTPKSKKNGDGTPKIGFSDAVQLKKIQKKKLSRFNKPIHRKSILTQSQFDLVNNIFYIIIIIILNFSLV